MNAKRQRTYSITEAKDRLPALVHEAETEKEPVRLTRRGKPVAVLVSEAEYQRLLSFKPKRTFYEAIQEFRASMTPKELEEVAAAAEVAFCAPRDPSPTGGREEFVWPE